MPKFLTVAAHESLLAAIIVVFLWSFAPEVEGRYFPVVDNVQVETPILRDDGFAAVSGRFDKIRDCQFRKIEWHLGSPGKSAIIDVEFMEGGVVWPVGNSVEFGPWHLNIPPAHVTGSFAKVYHECHPGYQTISHFYP